MNKDDFQTHHGRCISSTAAATITGVSPWDSPYALYQRMTGSGAPREETFPMWLGVQMEHIVIRAFTRETKLRVRRPRKRFDPNFWYETDAYGFPMGALLDGVTVDSAGEAVVEAKTGSVFAAADWDKEPPLHYWLQIQHQLAVTGWMHAYCPVILGNTFRYHLVERDDEMIAMLTDKERAFWNDYIVPGVPPPVDGHTATTAAVKWAYRRAAPGMSTVIEDAEVERLAGVYRALGTSITDLSEERDGVGNRLRIVLGDAESAVAGPYTITCKDVTQKRIDTKRLRAERPEIAEEYTYESEPTRPLRVTKRKD